jgi:ABC-type sugar transport system permease subunit
MLVTSGALQSIPSDIYEAAQVDGATGWQRFWNITLPLLLVSVGPLMISSFIFNFNNFNLIYAFINGGPPIPTATTQVATRISLSAMYTTWLSPAVAVSSTDMPRQYHWFCSF